MKTADEVRTFTVEQDDDGVRLDRWFKRHLPQIGFNTISRWARTGQIRVDGKRAKPEDRVEAGQEIRVPPGGESLKDTGARVWPYFLHEILPHVLRGETVLVAAHGNSLRSLVMALDGLSGEEIVKMEIATGVPIVYRLNADSTVASKEVLDD